MLQYMKAAQSHIERSTFRLFLGCMFLCATLVIVALWVEPDDDTLVKIAATLFVVGFASFLTWLPILLYKISGR